MSRSPSRRSMAGLLSVNFLMADVQNGVGPYLSAFLSGSRHWQAGPIGLVMAASSLAAALCQIPAGLLVDQSHAKRLLTAAAGLVVAAGCLCIAWLNGFGAVLAAQILLGAASAVIPPAVSALALGLVGPERMAAQVSRNETWNHAGSFVAAGLAGLAGKYVGAAWIFYLVCIFAIASAAATRLIVPSEIDHAIARGEASDNDHEITLRQLLGRRDIQVFLVSVVLFHFGNAAMLPFAGQELAHTHPGSDTMALSACVIVAQLVMMAASWGVGRGLRAGFGRRTIFLLAYAILPVRGILFAYFSSPMAVVGIQLLDGVAAGVFSVLSVIVAADLTRGTGRFNLCQGLVALCVSIGGAASNALGGWLVQAFGFHAAFLALAGCAGVACGFFAWAMPETAPSHSR